MIMQWLGYAVGVFILVAPGLFLYLMVNSEKP